MSVHVISWVLRHSDETLGRRLVLLVLADHAREDGSSAWPSIDTIATQARLSKRQAQRCLRDLESSGAIVETGRSAAGTHVYNVAMQGRQIVTPATDHISPGVTFTPAEVPEMSPDPSGPVSTATSNDVAAAFGDGVEASSPSMALDVVAGDERKTAQDLVALVVDRFSTRGVVVSTRHKGIIAQQAAGLLDDGVDFGTVAVAAVIAIRRGAPQHLHFVAADLGIAKAGERMSRREYERALEDEMEVRRAS